MRLTGLLAHIVTGLAAFAYWALLPSLFGELIGNQAVADAQLSAAMRGLDIFWTAATTLLATAPAALPAAFGLVYLNQAPTRSAWVVGLVVAGFNGLYLLGDWAMLAESHGRGVLLGPVMELLIILVVPVWIARWMSRVLIQGSGTDATARRYAAARSVGR